MRAIGVVARTAPAFVVPSYREAADQRRAAELMPGAPIFVVQLHDARRLHYDVRLEIDGVLKSWAVPRGPSLDPAIKRLAVPTDDHAMEYAVYEGVHEGSKYGSGAVIVWDAGTYRSLTKDSRGRAIQPADALAGGHLKVELRGTKLAGAWAFTRTGRDGDWLLVKVRDAAADTGLDLTVAEPRSVLSGLTIEEMAATTP